MPIWGSSPSSSRTETAQNEYSACHRLLGLARQLDELHRHVDHVTRRDAHGALRILHTLRTDDNLVLARRDHRSPSVTGLIPRAKPAAIVKRMRELGYELGGGQPPLKDTTFRIGHMGDHTVAGVQAMLSVLEEAMRSVA